MTPQSEPSRGPRRWLVNGRPWVESAGAAWAINATRNGATVVVMDVADCIHRFETNRPIGPPKRRRRKR